MQHQLAASTWLAMPSGKKCKKHLQFQGWRHDVGLPGIKDHLGGQGCLPHAHQHEELPVLISGPLRLLDFVVPLLDEAGDDCIQVQGGGLLGQKLELCPALAHQRSSSEGWFRLRLKNLLKS